MVKYPATVKLITFSMRKKIINRKITGNKAMFLRLGLKSLNTAPKKVEPMIDAAS